MPLEDVLDEARWPQPKGLKIRRARSEDQLTIEISARGIDWTTTASIGVIGLSFAMPGLMALGLTASGATLALRGWHRRSYRGLLLSVRADQLRWPLASPIEFEHITSIEAVGSYNRELWIRRGKIVDKHWGQTEHVEFLARWLNTLRAEAEKARAIRI